MHFEEPEFRTKLYAVLLSAQQVPRMSDENLAKPAMIIHYRACQSRCVENCYCGPGSIPDSLAVGFVVITKPEPRIKTNGLFYSMRRMEIDLTHLDLIFILQNRESKLVVIHTLAKAV